MSDAQVKRRILDLKEERKELLDKIVKSPWNSELATRLIGINEVIRMSWFDLGNEAKYEEGMSPYLN